MVIQLAEYTSLEDFGNHTKKGDSTIVFDVRRTTFFVDRYDVR
jgi:hypothetical protein